MLPAALVFLSAITLSQGCVPTSTVTTTKACCAMLSTSTLPRVSPTYTGAEQCSILRRVSSTCPTDGIVVCDAADETNPTNIALQFFDGTTLVRTQSVTGSPASSVSVRVVCNNGVWQVPTSKGATTYDTITSVSCSQSGSQGYDAGYVTGTAD